MDWPDWGDALGEDRDPDRWALDIVIGQPELWNKGLGTRAVRMLLAYLFERKAASDVALTPLAWNGRAIRCYEKAGFRKVRLLPKSELHEGGYQDAWLLKVASKG